MSSDTPKFNALVAQAINLIEAERGCILTYDGSGAVSLNTLMLVGGHKIDRQTLQGSEFEACYANAIEPVFEHGEAVVTSNSSSIETSTLLLRGAVRSILCVPLKRGGEIFGVLYVDSQIRKRILTSKDLPSLVVFAEEVAQAVGG